MLEGATDVVVDAVWIRPEPFRVTRLHQQYQRIGATSFLYESENGPHPLDVDAEGYVIWYRAVFSRLDRPTTGPNTPRQTEGPMNRAGRSGGSSLGDSCASGPAGDSPRLTRQPPPGRPRDPQ